MPGLVISIGNELMGDDGAGPLLARLLEEQPIPGWEVIDCGSVPENFMHKIRAAEPERIVVVDACEMYLEAGSTRLLSEADIASQFILSTHQLPLSFFLGALKELAAEVWFVGIQPKRVAFGLPVSPEVKRAVEMLYRQLQTGQPNFPWIEPVFPEGG